MIVALCVYAPASGRILRVVRCSAADVDLQAGDDEAVVEGEASDLTHYVVDGAITPRAPLEIACADTWPADDATPLAITGLPEGAAVVWAGPDGASGTLIANDGSVGLVTNAPGAYRFAIDEPAHLPVTLTATATP